MASDTKNKKPGDTMLKIGLVTLVIGIGLALMPLVYTGGEWGAPGPILLMVVGLILAAFGFGKRVLGALEKR